MGLKRMLCVTVIIFNVCFCVSQNTSYVDELAKACVYLESRKTLEKEIDRVKYELWKKDTTNDSLTPIETINRGTGFIVEKNGLYYLVTAEHVARATYTNATARVKGRTADYYETFLDSVVVGNWNISNEADVAVAVLDPNSSLFSNGGPTVIPYDMIENQLIAPKKEDKINSLGFPLGLGAEEFSPISLSSYPASDLISQPRADNHRKSTFFILDSPSIPGLSGGPVIANVAAPLGVIRFGATIKLIGLTHAVQSDNTGGKFSLVVPSYYILKTLESVDNVYSGTIKMYHENGSIWTEREYKNGLLWEVLYNKDANGNEADKGTLKKGNGDMMIYDEEGVLVGKYLVENGIRGGFQELKKR